MTSRIRIWALSAPPLAAISAGPPTGLFEVPDPVEVTDRGYAGIFHSGQSLNILAAAWIQFQVHDWVNHARYKLGQKDVEVELPKGMTWANRVGGPAEQVMRIADNKEFRTGANDQPPILFANAASHWWDVGAVWTRKMRMRYANRLTASRVQSFAWMGAICRLTAKALRQLASTRVGGLG